MAHWEWSGLVYQRTSFDVCCICHIFYAPASQPVGICQANVETTAVFQIRPAGKSYVMYLVQKAMETAASDSLILSNGLPRLLGIPMHKVVTSSLSVGDQD